MISDFIAYSAVTCIFHLDTRNYIIQPLYIILAEICSFSYMLYYSSSVYPCVMDIAVANIVKWKFCGLCIFMQSERENWLGTRENVFCVTLEN